MKQERDNQFSEEVQDIIDRMPTYWCTWVAGLVLVIVFLLVAAGCVIKYPDTITGTITIREGQHAVRMVSPSAGRLRLLLNNHDYVHEGDVIAYIENGASFSDVKMLDSICHVFDVCDSIISFPKAMALGELSSTYSKFLITYQNYHMMLHTRLYDNMRRSLSSKIDADSRRARLLEEEAALHGKNSWLQQKAFADRQHYLCCGWNERRTI